MPREMLPYFSFKSKPKNKYLNENIQIHLKEHPKVKFKFLNSFQPTDVPNNAQLLRQKVSEERRCPRRRLLNHARLI